MLPLGAALLPQVLITTETKEYTAFDMRELLQDLRLDPSVLAQLAFLEAEPDLHAFAAPGVDTFVSYGSGMFVCVHVGVCTRECEDVCAHVCA